MERWLVPSGWHGLWCDDVTSHGEFWGKRTRKYPTREVRERSGIFIWIMNSKTNEATWRWSEHTCQWLSDLQLAKAGPKDLQTCTYQVLTDLHFALTFRLVNCNMGCLHKALIVLHTIPSSVFTTTLGLTSAYLNSITIKPDARSGNMLRTLCKILENNIFRHVTSTYDLDLWPWPRYHQCSPPYQTWLS